MTNILKRAPVQTAPRERQAGGRSRIVINEFTQPDKGCNAKTNDDVELTRPWEYAPMQAVIDQLSHYRKSTAPR